MRRTLFIVCLFLGPFYVFSQGKVSYNYDQKRFNPYLNRFSYTFNVGFSAYSGELSGFFDPDLQNYYFNPGLGLGFAYRINDHLSVRAEANGFSLSSKSINYGEKERSFTGVNFDYYLNGVVNLFQQGKIDGLFHKWDPVIFGGIGQVAFFPKSNVTNDFRTGIIVTDSSTSTHEHASLSMIFPVGAGVKYYLDKNHYISFEGMYHFTRTDFLDAIKDLSHTQFDRYFTLFFKYTVIIDRTPGKSFNYGDYIRNRKKIMRE